MNTQKAEIVIDVIGTQCKLESVKPNMSAFEGIVGVAMTPGQLVSKLQRRGINIAPYYSDALKMDGYTVKVQMIFIAYFILLDR